MREANAEQRVVWNGDTGLRWTRNQDMQDALLAPVTRALMDAAAPTPGERVVDVGCGCGDTTVELARRVGPAGTVLGVDFSAPMLSRARARVPKGLPVSFAEADASLHPFEPACADLLFSRFGVIFFDRPVEAFANLRKALRRGGRLAFVCWREPRRNPWMFVPLQAACRHVPPLPQPAPEEPGSFSFARPERARRILTEAGFVSIGVEPCDVVLDLALGRGLETAVETALMFGWAGQALKGQPPEVAAAARASVREALAPFQVGQTVPLGSAAWIYTARND